MADKENALTTAGGTFYESTKNFCDYYKSCQQENGYLLNQKLKDVVFVPYGSNYILRDCRLKKIVRFFNY